MVWAGRAISLLRFVKAEAKLGTVWLLRVQEQIMCLDRVPALETISKMIRLSDTKKLRMHGPGPRFRQKPK